MLHHWPETIKQKLGLLALPTQSSARFSLEKGDVMRTPRRPVFVVRLRAALKVDAIRALLA
jgi:hypothetical protein